MSSPASRQTIHLELGHRLTIGQRRGTVQWSLACIFALVLTLASSPASARCAGICISEFGNADAAQCANERVGALIQATNEGEWCQDALNAVVAANVAAGAFVIANKYKNIPSNAGGYCGSGGPSNPNNTICGVAIESTIPTCPANYTLIGTTCIPDAIPDPGAEAGVNCPRGGNPISFGSGNKLAIATDYEGVGSMPLVWKRYYNSIEGAWHFTALARSIGEVRTKHSGGATGGEISAPLFYGQTVEPVSNETNVLHFRLFRPDGKSYIAIQEAGSSSFEVRTTKNIQMNQLVDDSFEVILPDGTVELYDADGHLTSITNRAGRTTAYTRTSGLLTIITDPAGRTLTIGYDGQNRIDSMVDPAGNEFLYTYDANSNLEFVIYPDDTPLDPADNPRRQYHYEDLNDDHLLTGITDELGIRLATYAYDSEGRATSTELAGGVNQFTVTYNSDVSVSTVNPLGKQTDYTFETYKGVRQVSQVDGVATALCDPTVASVGYDSNGHRSSRTDENGNVTDFTVDSLGRVTTRIDAFGTPDAIMTTTVWHPTLDLPTQIVRPGQTVDILYDSAGRMLTRTVTDTQTQTVPYVTNGSTRVTTYTYNAAGLVETIDGPRTDVSDITTYAYDANGDLTTITNALGHVTEITARDPRGMPTQVEDANDVVTDIVYDERGRLTTRSVQSGQGAATTVFAYNDASQLDSITTPDGVVISYEYDDAHRLDAIENSLGERIEYTLDAAGNRTAEITRDSGSNIVRSMSRLFDELSRLREDIGAQSQTTSLDYDLANNLTNVEDALLNQTIHSLDALDRITTITDALLNDTTMDYDDRDNLTQVVDPRGIASNFVYDGLDNLIQEESADAGTSVHLYDAAGNRTQTTDARGIVTQFAYDALNRLTGITYPGNPSVTPAIPANPAENVVYGYDTGTNGIGRLRSVSDISGSTTYAYDDRGNVLSETRIIGAITYVTGYSYDLNNNILTTTYPSGRIVTFARDTLARVDAVTTQTDAASVVENVATNIEYLPFGPSTGWTFGNDSVVSRMFDQDFRMTDLQVTTSSSVGQMDRDYLFDAVHNITDISDVLDSSRTQTFTYDELYRLDLATGVYGAYDFDFDEVGNRIVKTVDGTIIDSYTYMLDSNRLSTVNENGDLRIFSYDESGNILLDDRGSGPDVLYEYNDRNRLVRVEVSQ